MEQIPSLQGFMYVYTCWNIPDSSQCGLEDREMVETDGGEQPFLHQILTQYVEEGKILFFSAYFSFFLAEALEIRLPKDKQYFFPVRGHLHRERKM